ncbi:putative AB hydrolase-1 domain-containing protein [Seiridium cardinale]|uniref:AB hydrolase-1 domain-containing protein n=1 Tax=Seiridium cardinale TaxID=138064 RepID=A0ABR2Y9R6_9PEZI
MFLLVSLLLATIRSALTQSFPTAAVQNNTFNATHGPYNPTTAWNRILEANLSEGLSEAVLTAVNFERSNWAGDSVRLDPFYTDVPLNWTASPAGSVIKVEERTNTSLYSIAPSLAISRLLFTTKTLNGTVIPASAFVLWPWMPRQFTGQGANSSSPQTSGIPVIAWGHGTSGWSAECGPSHIRHLWYQFMIFTAATQGYVVVAPDYAGLGLGHDGQGNAIPHPYLATEAQGNDLLYAVKAAQKAWPILGDRYVVMGHSQGGGAAWGAARVLAGNGSDVEELKRGYLGTVAGSPWSSFRTSLELVQSSTDLNSIVSRVATGVASVFPSFSLSDWLTDKGQRVVTLLQDLQGCQSVAVELFTTSDLIRDEWNQTWYFDAFDKLNSNIGKPLLGPMLILQGTGDSSVNITGVSAAFNDTCEAFPDTQIEFVTFDGVSHSPAMFSGQQTWLKWIDARFEGKDAGTGCRRTDLEPIRAVADYQKDRNWFLEWTPFSYTTA